MQYTLKVVLMGSANAVHPEVIAQTLILAVVVK